MNFAPAIYIFCIIGLLPAFILTYGNNKTFPILLVVLIFSKLLEKRVSFKGAIPGIQLIISGLIMIQIYAIDTLFAQNRLAVQMQCLRQFSCKRVATLESPGESRVVAHIIECGFRENGYWLLFNDGWKFPSNPKPLLQFEEGGYRWPESFRWFWQGSKLVILTGDRTTTYEK